MPMKTLLTYCLLLVATGALAQGSPQATAQASNRKTVLLVPPAPAAATAPAVGPNAVPPLTVPRSQYIMTDGRITGGKTTFKSKKK